MVGGVSECRARAAFIVLLPLHMTPNPLALACSDGAANIKKVSLDEVEKLYLSLPNRANDKHVMLVMYAPWCSYCKSMEPEVQRAGGQPCRMACMSISAPPGPIRDITAPSLLIGMQ